ECVASRIETSPHVGGEEEEGDDLRAQGSDRGSPHAERWKAEIPEYQDVVQDDVGTRQDDRRRDEHPRPSQAHQQGAVGEGSGGTRKTKSIESATAIAPSSVTPTRARKIVSIRWRTASLVCAKMIGSETLQTTRERLSVVMSTGALRPLPRAGRSPVASRGERE